MLMKHWMLNRFGLNKDLTDMSTMTEEFQEWVMMLLTGLLNGLVVLCRSSVVD